MLLGVRLCVCVCDGTIECWETQIVARLSGYGALFPCVWITCFSYMPHCCLGHGRGNRAGVKGGAVACVLNCICLTFWHVRMQKETGKVGRGAQNYICPLRNAAQSGDDDSVEWNATGN